MNAAVGLMDGLGLDGDRCIRVIPRQILPAKELKNIPAKVLMTMMMKYYKVKLVTCIYLQSVKNTMLIMMIIHCVKWFMDQRMCHIMKTAKNFWLSQTTDMSRKDNLKLLYNSLPEGMCDNQYESLEQDVNDVETFQYSHETSTKHVLVQGVYVGSASPLIADIKTQPYSMLTYLDDGMMTGTYDNTHDIPIYIDNGSTLNIMPTHFYDNAYYLHHLLKAPTAAKTIQTGNGPVKTHFWIDILLNVQGCMIQFKLLVCDTQAQTGILLSKMALEQLQTWQDYSNNTLYIKQTAIPLHAIQNIELLPDRKTTIEVIADRSNELQYKDIIGGQGIVWVWSNDSSKPLQPIVATFHNDKTLITFENTTGQTQYITKGAKLAVLDMHSKDRGMTNFEWDIPTNDEGNLVLYAPYIC